MNTGTSALHLALLAADIGPGDEVITVPFTFVATVAAIHYTRRHAGVRRHRPAAPSRWTRRRSRRRSRRAPRPSCRCTCTASPPTWTRSWRSRSKHRLIVHRRRLPGARRRVQGPARRQHGRHGRLQLLPGQEPRRLRRRRHGDDRQRRVRAHHPHAARLGRREEVPARAQGLQLPAGGHPGRGAAREAASTSRSWTEAAPRRGRALRPVVSRQRRSDAVRACRTTGTSITSMRSARRPAPPGRKR